MDALEDRIMLLSLGQAYIQQRTDIYLDLDRPVNYDNEFRYR